MSNELIGESSCYSTFPTIFLKLNNAQESKQYTWTLKLQNGYTDYNTLTLLKRKKKAVYQQPPPKENLLG